VEALRNMMTGGAVRSFGASGARGRGGGLRQQEHLLNGPDARRLVLFAEDGCRRRRTRKPPNQNQKLVIGGGSTKLCDSS